MRYRTVAIHIHIQNILYFTDTIYIIMGFKIDWELTGIDAGKMLGVDWD